MKHIDLNTGHGQQKFLVVISLQYNQHTLYSEVEHFSFNMSRASGSMSTASYVFRCGKHLVITSRSNDPSAEIPVQLVN